jgi:hypothetical protein
VRFVPFTIGVVKPRKLHSVQVEICFSSKGILQDGANAMHVWAWEGSGKPMTGMRQMAQKFFAQLFIMRSAVPSCLEPDADATQQQRGAACMWAVGHKRATGSLERVAARDSSGY